VLAKFSKSRVWNIIPKGSTLIFEDTRISLQHSLKQVEVILNIKHLLDLSSHFDTTLACDRCTDTTTAYTALAERRAVKTDMLRRNSGNWLVSVESMLIEKSAVGRICNEIVFKPGIKEEESWITRVVTRVVLQELREWWTDGGRLNDRCRARTVRDTIGTRMSDRDRELIPETYPFYNSYGRRRTCRRHPDRKQFSLFTFYRVVTSASCERAHSAMYSMSVYYWVE